MKNHIKSQAALSAVNTLLNHSDIEDIINDLDTIYKGFITSEVSNCIDTRAKAHHTFLEINQFLKTFT